MFRLVTSAQGMQRTLQILQVLQNIAGGSACIAGFEGAHCMGVWKKRHGRHCCPRNIDPDIADFADIAWSIAVFALQHTLQALQCITGVG